MNNGVLVRSQVASYGIWKMFCISMPYPMIHYVLWFVLMNVLVSLLMMWARSCPWVRVKRNATIMNMRRMDHVVCCLLFEPHTGFRYVEVRERRTALDYAEFMSNLVNKHYSHVEQIRLVQDNLNTHQGHFLNSLILKKHSNSVNNLSFITRPRKVLG